MGCIVLEARENNAFVTGFCFILDLYLLEALWFCDSEDHPAKLTVIALLLSKNKQKGTYSFSLLQVF